MASPCTAMCAGFFAFQPARFMCAALFFCPFSGEVLIPLLRPLLRQMVPSGEAAGMEANKRRLTLDLASTLQRWLKVWRSRVSACAGAVKPPSTWKPTKGEVDTPLLGSAMRHSQHALGAPSGQYAARPQLRARGFSSRAGRQDQTSWPTGLPGCLARTRSSRCSIRAPGLSGWRGCPTPPVSPRRDGTSGLAHGWFEPVSQASVPRYIKSNYHTPALGLDGSHSLPLQYLPLLHGLHRGRNWLGHFQGYARPQR